MMYRPPLIPEEYAPVERSIRHNEREAAAGCKVSAAWLAETSEQRARIDRLRATALPERAPDYDGPWVMPIAARYAGRPHRSVVPPLDKERIVREYMERLHNRSRLPRTPLPDPFGD
jgi:hypothetical protein